MLIDHADPARLRIARIAHLDFLLVEAQRPAIRDVETHDAFDERRLAGAVFAEKRMERAGRNVNRYIVERDQRAEYFRHADRFERRRALRNRRSGGERRLCEAHGALLASVARAIMATGPPPSGP